MTIERHIAAWRAAYRAEHGCNPPERLERLKRLNREKLRGEKPPPITLRDIIEKIPEPPKRKRGAYNRRPDARKPYSLSTIEVLKILDDYDKGRPLKVIAAKFDCSPAHVRAIARRNGRPSRNVQRIGYR